MKKLIFPMLIAILCAGSIRADDAVQRVITIRNGNRNGIMHTIQDLVAGTPVRVSTSDNDHVILSGPKDMVTGFEEVIKQLDIPPAVKKDVETTVYMIVASQTAGTGSVPTELDPVAKQLKNIFSYKTFRLLESFVLRSRDGENGSTSGTLLAEQSPENPLRYEFQYRRVSLDGVDNARSVRFEHLHFSLQVPVGHPVHYESAGIESDVDVPDGKKVVVGKTSGLFGADSALILVISAKVVD